MTAWNIAIIGATGIVGHAIIELLEERNFPVASLFAVASQRSEGNIITFKSEKVAVQILANMDWSTIHLVFLATREKEAIQAVMHIAESGCVVIDCSGFFANSSHVAVALPAINEYELANYRQYNIIAIPNGIVTQLLKTTAAITDPKNIVHLDVSSYIPASFYGKRGIEGLARQSARLLNGLPVEDDQIAFTIKPAINTVDTTVQDEALVAQCRRVMNEDQLAVSFNVVNVPTFYGLAQNINIALREPIDIEQLIVQLKNVPTIDIMQNNATPSLIDKGKAVSALLVGNFRYAYGMPELLQLWAVTADNGRTLGALPAIEIAECLIREYL